MAKMLENINNYTHNYSTIFLKIASFCIYFKLKKAQMKGHVLLKITECSLVTHIVEVIQICKICLSAVIASTVGVTLDYLNIFSWQFFNEPRSAHRLPLVVNFPPICT